MGLSSAYRQRAAKAAERRQMSETPHDPFAEFYRRRVAELQAALLKAQTKAEKEKTNRNLTRI